MALTQADLDALDSAIVSGVLKVRLEGREVTYQTTDELIKARAHAAQILAAGSSAVQRSTYHYTFATSRGD